jgi:hypothetical protein
MSARRNSRLAAQKNAAKSSSILLGLALPIVLTQSALVSASASLTAFGWALIAALSGSIASTILNWSGLINTLLPERETWKRALLAGLLVACGLFAMGWAVASHTWTVVCCLSLAFIPWSRSMWRLLWGNEILTDSRSRFYSLFMAVAAFLFIWPELANFFAQGTLMGGEMMQLPQLLSNGTPLPRCFSLLAALFLGAASSLQRAQDRSISSATFWTIPTAIAAIVLSLSGWVALQLLEERTILLGKLQTSTTNRFVLASPSILFGILLLALRPRIHIKNSLLIGRDFNMWWQSLGVTSGVALMLFIISDHAITGLEVALFVIVLSGQCVGLRRASNSVSFAPTLSLVSESLPELSAQTSRQTP